MHKQRMQWLKRAVVAACAVSVAGVGPFSAWAADPTVQPSDAPVAPIPETPQQWFENGRATVNAARRLKPNTRRARNVILFVGDGMGVSTVTAARILEGQQKGLKGEENKLDMETLPHLALSKTYSANQQTSDSAPTMTAMVTGTKTSDGLLSVTQNVPRKDHTKVAGNELETLLEQAERLNMSTGVVSTARVTHATPAACYAHSPDRNWESDDGLTDAAKADGFKDIARQLVDFPVGDGLEVAMGGGRRHFLPETAADPEDAGAFGRRTDGRDLTKAWTDRYGARGKFVFDRAGFDAIDPSKTKHVLGLFERSHMEYEHDRATDTGGEPSIAEMTTKAIDMLSRDQDGYFLMVEAGRIDHAHHAGNAFRALTDTIAFDEAIKAAMSRVDLRETLIVVTADHSHVFTIAGYPQRGNPILGKVVGAGSTRALRPYASEFFSKDLLGLPYTTLGYQNGPGYTGASQAESEDGTTFTPLQPEGPKTFPHSPDQYTGITTGRPDLTGVATQDPAYLQEAAVPLGSETHAGEDVAIYAAGPGAYLFQGTVEQNVIYHVMAHALRLDRR